MKNKLKVGYFPILDHLILGVAEHNYSEKYKELDLETKIYSDWNPFIESLAKGEIDGAFMLFPLAFNMVQNGSDIKLVTLGHKEGQVLVARKDIERVDDLKGKRVLVPDKYSTHHILLHMILKEAGMSVDDVELKVGFKHPAEMVEVLKKDEVDAFVSAEPMGTESERLGVGNILKLSNEVVPHHVDCVLVFRTEVIEKNAEAIQELVDSLVKAGLFINAYPRQAAEIGEKFLGWPEKLLLRSITHDRGHILFWDLLPRPEEFAEFQDIAVNEMHLWEKGIDINNFIEPKFAQEAYRESVIETRQNVKDRGSERTLPGSFIDAVKNFDKAFDSKLDVAGLKFISSGEKYPSESEQLKNIPGLRTDFLDEVFEGKSFVIKTEGSSKKALAFFPAGPNEPDRVIIKASKDQSLKILEALEWGDKIENVKNYNENIADKDLFSPSENVSVVQDNKYTYFSLSFTVFRFLSLLIHHF